MMTSEKAIPASFECGNTGVLSIKETQKQRPKRKGHRLSKLGKGSYSLAHMETNHKTFIRTRCGKEFFTNSNCCNFTLVNSSNTSFSLFQVNVKGGENLEPHKNLNMDFYSNFIQNCQNLEATKMQVNGYIHSGTFRQQIIIQH